MPGDELEEVRVVGFGKCERGEPVEIMSQDLFLSYQTKADNNTMIRMRPPTGP